MTDARFSHLMVESIIRNSPSARLSHEFIETVIQNRPLARASQYSLETIIQNRPLARASQYSLETIIQNRPPARLSHLMIETISKYYPLNMVLGINPMEIENYIAPTLSSIMALSPDHYWTLSGPAADAKLDRGVASPINLDWTGGTEGSGVTYDDSSVVLPIGMPPGKSPASLNPGAYSGYLRALALSAGMTPPFTIVAFVRYTGLADANNPPGILSYQQSGEVSGGLWRLGGTYPDADDIALYEWNFANPRGIFVSNSLSSQWYMLVHKQLTTGASGSFYTNAMNLGTTGAYTVPPAGTDLLLATTKGFESSRRWRGQIIHLAIWSSGLSDANISSIHEEAFSNHVTGATEIFADAFDGSSLGAGWTAVGSPTVSGGAVTLVGDAVGTPYIRRVRPITNPPYYWEVYGYCTKNSNDWWCLTPTWGTDSHSYDQAMFLIRGDTGYFEAAVGQSFVYPFGGINRGSGNAKRYGIHQKTATTADLYIDRKQVAINVTTVNRSAQPNMMIGSYNGITLVALGCSMWDSVPVIGAGTV